MEENTMPVEVDDYKSIMEEMNINNMIFCLINTPKTIHIFFLGINIGTKKIQLQRKDY